MYGKGAKMIDVKNVNQITKTMNQLFLQNNEKIIGYMENFSYIYYVNKNN